MSHSWEKVLVTPEQSIKHALSVIDSEALRVALVVDNNNVLKGIVTDGDVRRGILSGLSVNECVDKVMNSTPVVADKSATKDELVELMNRLNLLSVPIIDAGRVIGLQTLRDTLVRDKKDNPCLLYTSPSPRDRG